MPFDDLPLCPLCQDAKRRVRVGSFCPRCTEIVEEYAARKVARAVEAERTRVAVAEVGASRIGVAPPCHAECGDGWCHWAYRRAPVLRVIVDEDAA